MKKRDYATFTSGNEKPSPNGVNLRNAFIEEFTVSEENLGNMKICLASELLCIKTVLLVLSNFFSKFLK